MGAPVVTLAGDHHVTRLSATKLTAVGATELISYDPLDYIRVAMKLAGSFIWHVRYYETLRDRPLSGPLGDPASLATCLENANRERLDRRFSQQDQYFPKGRNTIKILDSIRVTRSYNSGALAFIQSRSNETLREIEKR